MCAVAILVVGVGEGVEGGICGERGDSMGGRGSADSMMAMSRRMCFVAADSWERRSGPLNLDLSLAKVCSDGNALNCCDVCDRSTPVPRITSKTLRKG